MRITLKIHTSFLFLISTFRVVFNLQQSIFFMFVSKIVYKTTYISRKVMFLHVSREMIQMQIRNNLDIEPVSNLKDIHMKNFEVFIV